MTHATSARRYKATAMGIGIILIGFGLVFCVLAVFAGLVLAVIVTLTTKALRTSTRFYAAAIGFFLPLGLLAYFAVAFIGYALWCEQVRGVDCGVGDCWLAPIANGHTMLMVDVPDTACILGPTGEQLLEGTDLLGQHGKLLFGRVANDDPTNLGEATKSFFIIDTSTSATKAFPSEAALRQELAELGVNRVRLQSANSFYNTRRWGLADLAARSLIPLPPLALTAFLIWRFAKLFRYGRARRGHWQSAS